MEVANISMDEIAVILESEKDYNQRIDELEAYMYQFDGVECPLDHQFTPGLYARSILMPAGTLVVSMIHKEEHPYDVLMGSALVFIEGRWTRVEAPYSDVTPPGTRRVLYVDKTCFWRTFHAVKVMPLSKSKEDILAAVEANFDDLYVKRENPILGGMMINNKLTKLIES